MGDSPQGLSAGNLAGLGDSLSTSGRSLAPAAGFVFGPTNAAVAGGVYDIYVWVTVGPGGLTADVANTQLQEVGTPLLTLANPAPGTQMFGPYRRTNVGANGFQVVVVANATAAVEYAVTLIAVRIE